MVDILYCEWLKLKRSKIVWAGLWASLVVPVFVACNNIRRHVVNPDYVTDLFVWYDDAVMFLMLLFGPLAMSIVATYLISREYSEKTLKTAFAVPVRRGKFLWGKFLMLFILAMAFMVCSWLEILVSAMVCNLFLEVRVTALSAVFFLARMLKGGALLYVTVTPVVYLAIRAKGFVMPFAVTAAVCLLNVVLSGSPIAGVYPWTATYLMASGRMGEAGNLGVVGYLGVALVGIVSVLGSMARFGREDIG